MSNYLEKEVLVTKLVSDFVQTSSNYRLSFFTPNLTAFEKHIRNRYVTMVLRCVHSEVRFVSWKTWQNFCRSVLRVMMHVINNQLYLLGGYPTDSVTKIIRLTIGENPVDRWLIDICRELSRPMAKDRTLYVPFMPCTDDMPISANPKTAIYGMSIEQSQTVTVTFTRYVASQGIEELVSTREIVQEDVMISPLAVTDGEFMFVDNEVATWRKQISYQLVHFHNGCVVPNKDSKPPKGEAWLSRTLDREELENQADFTLNLIDRFIPDEAYVVPTGREMDALLAVANGEVFTTGGTHRLLVYWTVNRAEKYNDWLLSAKVNPSTLPPIDIRRKVVPDLLQVSKRFTSLESHSKTPNPADPQSTVRSDVYKAQAVANKMKSKPSKGTKQKSKGYLESRESINAAPSSDDKVV